MIDLLLEGRCEPPQPNGLHLSTLVQQILALISEYGGIARADAYKILCERGPFQTVDQNDFKELLEAPEVKELIEEDNENILFHGKKGEKIVNHFSFYAAFASEEEYRIISGTCVPGTIPIQKSLKDGDFIHPFLVKATTSIPKCELV